MESDRENLLSQVESKWMPYCLEMGKECLNAGEVPVGCIFLHDNVIVAEGRNAVNETKNPTRHAEMICVDQIVAKYKSNWPEIFKEITVVVNVEPCIMCAALLYDLKVKSILYGCCNTRFGGCASVLDISTLFSETPTTIGGILGDRAIDLLKLFYKCTNPNAPPSKVKVKS